MSCTSSSQCDNTEGLICPKTKGICNCPISSTTIFCDCSSGQYYDYTTKVCSMCCFLISKNLFKIHIILIFSNLEK